MNSAATTAAENSAAENSAAEQATDAVSKAGSYYQATLGFKGDPLVLGAQIVEAAAHNDYLLYENDDGWSLGMDVHAQVTVFGEFTVLSADGDQQVMRNVDLSRTISDALAAITVDEWRAYGTANFELALHNEGLPVPDKETPLVKLFVPRREVRYRADDSSLLLRSLDSDDLASLRETIEQIIANENGSRFDGAAPLTRDELPEVDVHDAERYMSMVNDSLREVRNLDYRKVILSRKVPLRQDIDVVASYVVGRRGNTPARSFLLSLEGLQAAGFCPETVVEVNDEGRLTTTPLAGTRAIGEDILEELRLREELVSDVKEIAEHAISVYMAFDELTMVCDAESVSVVKFMVVSRRGSVQHMASKLVGQLSEHNNSWHAFQAIFPAVTASGVPKRQSVEAIARHESEPRGLYSGCVLTWDQSGSFDSGLVLRSFFKQDGQTWLRAGAGVMNMSEATRELEETREKMASASRFLVQAQA